MKCLRQFTWKTWRGPFFLTILFFLILTAVVPAGVVYGSHMDWFSQHVALAESIRNACLEGHTLFPDFLNLGSGSNGYQCAYYGFGRPDILLGCLFPRIPMEYLLSGCMVAGYFLAVQLFFWWLKGEMDGEEVPALFGSVLFLTAGCFFQTHRQVMFINYMPALVGALLLVQKKKEKFLPLALVLIYLYSFYFAPACFLVLAWYWYKKERKTFWKPFLRTAFLSTGMAMVLLLPTGLVLLEHRRSSSGSIREAVTAFWPDFSSLLFSPYGIGLTGAVLYLLLAGLTFRRYRRECLAFLALCFWGAPAWLLNGTLYVRAKSLIPFLPLVVLTAVQVLTAIWKERRWKLWPLAFLAAVLVLHREEQRAPLLLAEAVILALTVTAGLLLSRRQKALPWPAFGLLLILPCLLYVQTAQREQWVTVREAEEMRAQETLAKGAEKDTLWRFENLINPLEAGNRTAGGNRTSLYTSIKNDAYIETYYHLLLTPVQINNRLAVLPADNPFLLRFLGIRTVETEKGHVSPGYQVVKEEGGRVLAENHSVMPLAYFSSSLLGESRFRTLSDMEKAAALMQKTIVPDSGEGRKDQSGLLSRWERVDVPWKGDTLPDTISFPETVKGKILVLEFDVTSRDGGKVVIDIGGQRNKLSSRQAPYPNENSHFRYVFCCPPEGIRELPVNVVSGDYTISGVRISTLDAHVLDVKFWTEVTPEKTEKNEILSCRVTARKDGYFVTSIPVQKGMEILVDGKTVPVETVNTTFAGARLEKGTHKIQVRFTPPGKRAGMAVSLVCLALWTLWITDIPGRAERTGFLRRKRNG